MASARLVTTTLLAASAAAVLSSACDNGAVGVEACREIESKKCEIVMGCPGSSVLDEGGVSTCKTMYRDQCLFGIADKVEPDPVQLEGCLLALDALAACKDAPSLSECEAAPSVSCPPASDDSTPTWCTWSQPIEQSACAVLLKTEHLDACAFLRPASTPSSTVTSSTAAGGGSGGMGGMGGMGGGSGGMGGGGV